MPTPFRIKQLPDNRWIPDHPEVESMVSYSSGGSPEAAFSVIRDSLHNAVENQYPGQYELDNHINNQREVLFSKIDQRTRDKISEGFMFEGMIFSLSSNAQTNYTAMLAAKELITYPITINTLDDTEKFQLGDQESVVTFCASALNAARGFIDLGTELKEAVRQANTVEELDEIVI